MNEMVQTLRSMRERGGPVGRILTILSGAARRREELQERISLSVPFRRLVYLVSCSRVASDIWYLLSRDFSREHQAVLRGRFEYLQSVATGEGTALVFKLRRNVHRLEKGLTMRPRRASFGEAYIGETVDLLDRLVSGNGTPSGTREFGTLSWAVGVLGNYFSVVSANGPIGAARGRFDQIVGRMTIDRDVAGTKIPYQRDIVAEPAVRIDALEALAKHRRSCRWFDQTPVPREMIDRAIGIAAQSPSACNRQPFRFVVIDDPALVQRIAAVPIGTAGYRENIPVFIVIVGDLSAFRSERDRHLIYVDAGLSAMALQFGLEAQGISSCCINWPDIEKCERKMEKALGLAAHERPVMNLAVGFPLAEGMVPHSEKLSLERLREYR